MAEIGMRRAFINTVNYYKNFYPVRNYSVYPPNFIDAVWKNEEVDKIIETKNEMEIKLMRVKAAPTHATCSVFFDHDVHLFTNHLMKKGNRKLAKELVNEAFVRIKRIQLKKYYDAPPDEADKIELDPVKIFHEALKNVTPVLTTRSVIHSGVKYQIPTVVFPKMAKFLGMKFIIDAAGGKDKRDRFYASLAHILLSAYENKGLAVQKKLDLHKFCDANRVYAHYRWT